MTKIKICGLSRPCDIEAVNRLAVDYIGFVFAQKSRRFVDARQAARLKKLLRPDIEAVGVFVNEKCETIAQLFNEGVIEIAQLHGSEDERYIELLRKMTDKPIIKAFRIDAECDIIEAQNSSADFVLLDSGSGGTGTAFDWKLIRGINRPYFLAGGLDISNINEAVDNLTPYAVDVSSGVETDGYKDKMKMAAFVSAVRKEDGK